MFVPLRWRTGSVVKRMIILDSLKSERGDVCQRHSQRGNHTGNLMRPLGFGERSLKASCQTGRVSTTHMLIASKLLVAPCDPRSALCCSRCTASWLDGFLNGFLNVVGILCRAVRTVYTLCDTFKCIRWPFTGVIKCNLKLCWLFLLQPKRKEYAVLRLSCFW